MKFRFGFMKRIILLFMYLSLSCLVTAQDEVLCRENGTADFIYPVRVDEEASNPKSSLPKSLVFFYDEKVEIVSSETMAADLVKKEFRLLKIIKVNTTLTESNFTVEANADTELPGTGFNIGGRALINWNTQTLKKDEIASGFIRGYGAEIQVDNDDKIHASYASGLHKLGAILNTNGEFSEIKYSYNGGPILVIDAAATGKISTTENYATANKPGSWSGGVTIKSNGSTITSLDAVVNFVPYAYTGGGYTFTITEGGYFSFSDDDIRFGIIFGFNW